MSFQKFSSAVWLRSGMRITFPDRPQTRAEWEADGLTEEDPNIIMRQLRLDVEATCEVATNSVRASSLADYLDPTDDSGPPTLRIPNAYGGTMPALGDGKWMPGEYSFRDTQRGGKTEVLGRWTFLGVWVKVDIST